MLGKVSANELNAFIKRYYCLQKHFVNKFK